MKQFFVKFTLPLFWVLSLGIICFLMCFTVNAESSNPLPFIVENENISGFSDFVNGCSRNGNYYWAYQQIQSNNYFGYDYYENGVHQFAFYFPESDFNYNIILSNEDYENFDITNNSMEMSFTNYTFLKGYFEYYAPRDVYYFYGQYNNSKQTVTNNIRFFVGSNKGNGSLLVPNISSQNYNYEDDIYQCVFGFGNPERPIIPNGHATAPNEFDSPVYTEGHAQPSHVPNSPTINNYSWTTYNNPPIDTTNLESLVGSLIDIVVYNFNYLFTNLGGLFNNLISNVQSFVNYIGQIIEYYGNLIISNIQNGITTFYNNMVSLVENISDKIGLITEPYDQNAVLYALENSDTFSMLNGYISFFNTFNNVFTDVSEPDSLLIPFHLEQIGLFHDHFITNEFYIDLSGFEDIRTPLRLFCWVFVTFGTVFLVENQLSMWLQGSQSGSSSKGG